MINSLLFPFIKKFRKLIISMILVSLLGISMMIGLSGSYHTLDYSLNNYVKEYNYADIVITTDETDKSIAEKIEKISSVKDINTRFVADVPVKLSDERLISVRAFSYGIRDFQEVYIWEENENADYPNIAVEYKFAKENNISAGDILSAKIGDTYEKFCVGSLISSPECLSAVRDNYSWGENADFGYFFVPENLLFGSEYERKCNQIIINTEEWADNEAVIKEVKNLLKKEGVKLRNSYTYENSAVSKRIEINLKPIKTMSIWIPLLFFVNMLAVVSLFMSQIIRQSRKDIGILRALGFEKRQIKLLFNKIALIITVIASIAGTIIGIGLNYFMSNIYGNYFPIPEVYYQLDMKMALIAAVITILTGQIASTLSCRLISSIMPSEAMTRQAPASSKTPKAVATLLKKCSAGIKYGITSIFRNAKRFVFSIICVAASVTLILVALSFDVSKEYILHQMYDLRTGYEAQVFVTEEPDEEEILELKEKVGVTHTEKLSYRDLTIVNGDKSSEVTVCGIEPGTELVGIYDGKDNKISLKEDGIILESHTAKELGLSIGDKVHFEETDTTLVVTGLSEQCVNRIQYVSEKVMKSLGEADQYTIILNGAEEKELLNTASEWETYSYANFTNLMRKGNEDTFKTYTYGVYVLIFFAVVLGFLIVFNTIQTNLLEQKKELSVLRALGFQIREISRLWFIQTFIQFICSVIIGLPLGTVIAKYSLAQMATDGREYPFIDDPMQFAVTVIIVFAYIVISHLVAMKSIRKWIITENINEKE